jgi:hypothetical protein
LSSYSDQVRKCYECAAEARARADPTNDSTLKAEWLNAERRWLGLAASFGFTESLTDSTANSEWRRTFNGHLQQLSAPVAQASKNLDGPDDILQLHEISRLLIQEGTLDALYNRILDAAIGLMARAPDGLLILHWTESGGPPAKKPRREGFGTSVIDRMIREQLKGEMPPRLARRRSCVRNPPQSRWPLTNERFGIAPSRGPTPARPFRPERPEGSGSMFAATSA